MGWHDDLTWAAAHRSWISLGAVRPILTPLAGLRKRMRALSDERFLRPMEEAERKRRLDHPGRNLLPLPFRVEVIARWHNMSVRRANKRLRALESQGRVREVKHGEWCLGNQTHKEILDKVWALGLNYAGF